MRILIVGATGTIGTAVTSALSDTHEIIGASRNGDVSVDLSDPDSIKAMNKMVGNIDAVISTAGSGQINLVRFGREFVNGNGSFTQTSGILADQPNPASVLITTLNTSVEGFARASALRMTNGQRVNVVSPPMVKETAIKLSWGDGGMPASEVAQYYVRSLEPGLNGIVIGSTY